MSEKKLFELIATELNLNIIQVKNTVELLDSDNTVPFISRYRKEKTGSLDEEIIRQIEDRIHYLRQLEDRKKTILKSIKEQGKLTPQLEKHIQNSMKSQELEDLYLPYKPKKRTRASIAREKGLEPLAQIILAQELATGHPLDVALDFVDIKKDVNSAEEALAGAKDILAEVFSENAEIRKDIRGLILAKGSIHASARSKESDREYEMYFDFYESLKKIPAHRLLALNRGETKKALKINIEIDLDTVLSIMHSHFIKNTASIFYQNLLEIIKDAYNRLISPSINREIRALHTEAADKQAIQVFALNLQKLLLQPPITEKIILGIDPGYRTGCKVAVIEATGKYLEGMTIFPHAPQKKYFEAKSTLRELIEKRQVDIIAIGNGTACRETELMIAELLKEMKSSSQLSYIVVSEAGASVYSASQIAREEFPDLEASMRGNISIARRLQDPLAELVKIDPKNLGVGMYQHDVDQKRLKDSLFTVVESCVNLVGVDVNTASTALLSYVSGLTKNTAGNIVKFRNNNGQFIKREQLKKIQGIGDATFQQAAGFLRIRGGENALDATSIHPESYPATEKLLKIVGIKNFTTTETAFDQQLKNKILDKEMIAKEIGCGVPTLEDILLDLSRPGRDPREDLPKPIFKSDVLKMEDLREGMILKGTVRNVVDFGIFVDIGVKHDGLVHVSQMADRFVKSPYKIAGVGDIITVRVLKVDINRERISLSMKDIADQ